MSSPAVRTALKAYIETAFAPLQVKDLSNHVSLKEALPTDGSEVVLIQFILSTDELASTGGEGNQMWLESGTVAMHLIVPTEKPTDDSLAIADAAQKALRGSRVNADLTIESCEPFTDFGGASGIYPGAWKGWLANLYYENRTCG